MQLETLRQRAEAAEAALRAREHQEIEREVRENQARQDAMREVRLREQKALRDAEVEEIRKGAWLLHLTAPERFTLLAQNGFDPTFVANHTPASGWPPGDSEEAHAAEFRNPLVTSLPEFQEGDEPSLVKEAQSKGIPV